MTAIPVVLCFAATRASSCLTFAHLILKHKHSAIILHDAG